jgi:hypothetical protein
MEEKETLFCFLNMNAELAPKIVPEIINEELQKTEFKGIAAKEDDFFSTGEDQRFYFPNSLDKNFSAQILDRISINHFNSDREFYHFKNAERIIEVLRQKILYATNLPSHNSNDNVEYSAFTRIYLDTTNGLSMQQKKNNGIMAFMDLVV